MPFLHGAAVLHEGVRFRRRRARVLRALYQGLGVARGCWLNPRLPSSGRCCVARGPTCGWVLRPDAQESRKATHSENLVSYERHYTERTVIHTFGMSQIKYCAVSLSVATGDVRRICQIRQRTRDGREYALAPVPPSHAICINESEESEPSYPPNNTTGDATIPLVTRGSAARGASGIIRSCCDVQNRR